MKLSENQCKAIQTCIQTIVTALLLFIQSFYFSGCISNKDGTINQNNDFSVPIYVPNNLSEVLNE